MKNPRCVLPLILSLTACSPAAVKPDSVNDAVATPAAWGVQHTTPGARMLLERRGDTTAAGRPAAAYGIVAQGFPPNRQYAIWSRWLNGKTAMVERVQSDGQGNLVSGRGVPLKQINLTFYEMHRGEPIEVGLVAVDQTTKAFARAIPFPLQVDGAGGCRLSLQMMAPGGRQFMIVGTGFMPGEELTTMMSIDGKSQKGKAGVTPDGRFAGTIDSRASVEAGGTALFSAAGKSCKAKLKYEWGTAMKKA